MSLTRGLCLVQCCVAILFALGYVSIVNASESSGTITTGFINAKVCHSVGCVTPTPGVINFKPTGTTPVTIDDTLGIDGVAWGNELGWVTLDPTGPEGLVINTTTGAISGKAWSQVAGWVNFAPTGQGVSINSSGEFAGWAWAGGPYGGWIKFDCTDGAACVKTDWRPVGVRTVTTTPTSGNGPVSGSGGGGGSPNDECWNVAGIQFSVPSGYTKVGSNMCQVTSEMVATNVSTDICLNIAGIQTTVPSGYTRDTGGLCVPIPDQTTDTDRDGIPDTLETGDSDQDTVPDYLESNTIDTDGDGIPNYLDPDDDGDGYPTAVERTSTTDQMHTDFDGDGIPSFLDAVFNTPPSQKTGVDEEIKKDPRLQPVEDTSRDAPVVVPPEPTQPEPTTSDSPDADNDGIPDIYDAVVAPTPYLRGGDSDGDGVLDADECIGGYPCPVPPGSISNIPAYLDPQYPSSIPSAGTVDEPTPPVVEDSAQPDVIRFSFVPRALAVPVDAPAFREAFRSVLGTSLTSALLHDATAQASVDVVSLSLLVGSVSLSTLGVTIAVLRVLGLLAFIL